MKKLDIKKLVKQSNTYKEFIDTVDNLVKSNPRERSFYTEQIVGPHIETSLKYLHQDPKYYNFGTDNIPKHLQDRIPYLQNVNNTTETSDGCVHFRASNKIGSLSKKTRNVRDKDKATSGKLIVNEARDMLEEGFDFHIHSSSDEFMSSKKEAQRKINKLGSKFIWMPDSEIEQNWPRIQKYILTKKKEMPNPVTWRADEGGPNGSSLEHMRKEGERVFEEKNEFFKKGQFKKLVWKNIWDWDTAVGKTTPIVLGLVNDYENCHPHTGQKNFVGEIINPRNAALRNNIVPVMEHFYTVGIKVRHFVFSGPPLNVIKDVMDAENDGVTLNDLPVERFDNFKTFRKEFKKALSNGEHIFVHRNWHTNDKMKKLLKSFNVKSWVHEDEKHHYTASPKHKSGMLNDDSYPMWSREGYTGTKRGKFLDGVKSKTSKNIIKKYFNYGLDNEQVHGKTRSVIGLDLAVKLGYKHDFRAYVPQYTKAQMEEWFGPDWKEHCAKNSYVRPANSKNIHAMTPDDFIYFHNMLSCINQGLAHHVINKCQDIKHARNTNTELLANLNTVLKAIPNSNKLKKLHTFVADTHNMKKDKIWKHINDIPKNYPLSLIFYAELIGESWSPKNGWVDGTGFLTNIRSYIKVSQGKGRGDRKDSKKILPFDKKFNRIFMPGFLVADDPEWNEKYFYQDVKNIIESMHFKDHKELYEKIIVISYNKPTKNSKKKRKTTVVNAQPVPTHQFNLSKLAKAIEESWIKRRILEKETSGIFNEFFPYKSKLSYYEFRSGALNKIIDKNINFAYKKFKHVFDVRGLGVSGSQYNITDPRKQRNKINRILSGESEFLSSEDLKKIDDLYLRWNQQRSKYIEECIDIGYKHLQKSLQNINLIRISYSDNKPETPFAPVREDFRNVCKKYGKNTSEVDSIIGILQDKVLPDYITDQNVKNKFAKLQLVLQKYISLQEKIKTTNKDQFQKLALDIVKDLPSFGVTQFYKLPAVINFIRSRGKFWRENASGFIMRDFFSRHKKDIEKYQIENTRKLMLEFFKKFQDYNGKKKECWQQVVKEYISTRPLLQGAVFNQNITTNFYVSFIYQHGVKTNIKYTGKKLENKKYALTSREYFVKSNNCRSVRASKGLGKKYDGGGNVPIFAVGKVFKSINQINSIDIPAEYAFDKKGKVLAKKTLSGRDAIKRNLIKDNESWLRFANTQDLENYFDSNYKIHENRLASNH